MIDKEKLLEWLDKEANRMENKPIKLIATLITIRVLYMVKRKIKSGELDEYSDN